MIRRAHRCDRTTAATPPGRVARRNVGDRLRLLVALLVLAWQGLVVQTHVHRPLGQLNVAVTTGTAVASAGKHALLVDECLLCAARGQAGEGAPLDRAVLFAAVALAVLPFRQILVERTARASSGGWRNRGPPGQLADR